MRLLDKVRAFLRGMVSVDPSMALGRDGGIEGDKVFHRATKSLRRFSMRRTMTQPIASSRSISVTRNRSTSSIRYGIARRDTETSIASHGQR